MATKIRLGKNRAWTIRATIDEATRRGLAVIGIETDQQLVESLVGDFFDAARRRGEALIAEERLVKTQAKLRKAAEGKRAAVERAEALEKTEAELVEKLQGLQSAAEFHRGDTVPGQGATT